MESTETFDQPATSGGHEVNMEAEAGSRFESMEGSRSLMSPLIAEDENSMLRMEEGEIMPRIKGAQSVQEIFFSSLMTTSSDGPSNWSTSSCYNPGSTRNGRPASRIPVPLHRRDSALSLPGSVSGRSTPMSDIYQPSFSVSGYQQSGGYQQRSKLPLQREGSLPSGLMATSLTLPKLSRTDSQHSIASSTSSKAGISKIPRRSSDNSMSLKKWDSTSKLEMSSLRRGSMTSSMTSLRSQPALPPKPTNIQIKKTSGGSYKVSGSSLKSPASGGGGSLKNVGSKATLSKPSSPKERNEMTFDGSQSTKSKSMEMLEESSAQQNEALPVHSNEYCPLSDSKGIPPSHVMSLDVEAFERMYKNLSKEHAKLANLARAWETKVGLLEGELKDARDSADLLEFRLLELEQRESRERTPELNNKTQHRIRLDYDDSGCSSETSIEDLLTVQKDFRNEKVDDTKVKLHELMEQIQEPGGKSLLLQTVALFETLLSKMKTMKEEADVWKAEESELRTTAASSTERANSMEAELVQTCEELEELKVKLIQTEKQLDQTRMVSKQQDSLSSQVQERQDQILVDLRKEHSLLLNKLETERMGHQAEVEMYKDAMQKLRKQEKIISSEKEDFKSKMAAMEAKLSAYEADKSADGQKEGIIEKSTKTEVLADNKQTADFKSGGKMPTADLKLVSGGHDSPNGSEHGEQLEESGIFDVTSMEQSIIEAEQLAHQKELRIESLKDKELEEAKEELEEALSAQAKKDALAASQLETLASRLQEMEARWEQLYNKHTQIVEEKCELEEAENDSRLRAQMLEVQYANVLERSKIMKDELIHERQTSDELRMQMDEMLNREDRNMEDIDSLRVHIQDQEEKIRELEARTSFYADQLRLLEIGVKLSVWWTNSNWSWVYLTKSGEVLPGCPSDEPEHGPESAGPILALEYDSTGAKENSRFVEKEMKRLQLLENQYKQREESLSSELSTLEEEFDSFMEQLAKILSLHSNDLVDKRPEILQKVCSLVSAEANLKQQITDLERKEAVYTKTIQEADMILARVERNAQAQIHSIEKEKFDLKAETRKILEEKDALVLEVERLKEVETVLSRLRVENESKVVPEYRDSSAQYDKPVLADSSVQSDKLVVTHKGVQLDKPVFADFSVQAELTLNTYLQQLTNLEALANKNINDNTEHHMDEDTNNNNRNNTTAENANIADINKNLEAAQPLVRKLSILQDPEPRLGMHRDSGKKEHPVHINITANKEHTISRRGSADIIKVKKLSTLGDSTHSTLDNRSVKDILDDNHNTTNNNDGETVVKGNKVRLEVKSLDRLDVESRTSDLASSERFSRSDPFSRGPSHDRDLSLTPGEHQLQQQHQKQLHGYHLRQQEQQLLPPAASTTMNGSLAAHINDKHDNYQDEDYDESYDHGDETDAETFRHRTELIIMPNHTTDDLKSYTANEERASSMSVESTASSEQEEGINNTITDVTVASDSINDTTVNTVNMNENDILDNGDIVNGRGIKQEQTGPDLISKLDHISEQINFLTSMLIQDFSIEAQKEIEKIKHASNLASNSNPTNLLDNKTACHSSDDSMLTSSPPNGYRRSVESESWISLSEPWSSSSHEYLSPSHSQMSITEPIMSSPEVWMSPMLTDSPAGVTRGINSSKELRNKRQRSLQPFRSRENSVEFQENLSKLHDRNVPAKLSHSFRLSSLPANFDKRMSSSNTQRTGLFGSREISPISRFENPAFEDNTEPSFSCDGFVTKIMLQYDTLSANNEITAIFRQDGGKPTPQLLYCRCLTTPDRKSSNTDTVKDSGDDSFDIIDNCSESDKETVIDRLEDSKNKDGAGTVIENVEKSPEKDNDTPKDDTDQKVDINDLQYAEVAKVEEVSKEDHENFDSIIQQQKEIITRLEQELNEKDTTLAELSKRLDLSQRVSERRKSSTEELTERRRSTEQQIIELRTNLARTRKQSEDQKARIARLAEQDRANKVFIVQDLRYKIDMLQEKCAMKDVLIRKLADSFTNMGADSTEVIHSLRYGMTKPSDRKLDFTAETLCYFIENSKGRD